MSAPQTTAFRFIYTATDEEVASSLIDQDVVVPVPDQDVVALAAGQVLNRRDAARACGLGRLQVGINAARLRRVVERIHAALAVNQPSDRARFSDLEYIIERAAGQVSEALEED